MKSRGWREVATVSLRELHRRWSSEGGGGLLERYEPGDDVWTVEGYPELVRLVGALHHDNPRLELWFRGQAGFHPSTVPRALRSAEDWRRSLELHRGLLELRHPDLRQDLLRGRAPVARLAILQHYGAPGPFLDATRDLAVALSFALEPPERDVAPESPEVLVFATPRPTTAVEIRPELGIVAVDLLAELPSRCLRPHLQRAAFLGDLECVAAHLAALSPRTGEDRCDEPPTAGAAVEELQIARIRLAGGRDDYPLRRLEHMFAPPARHPGDVDGDELLALLNDAVADRPDGFPGFPFDPLTGY
jgi:hypothetical protein